MLFNIFHKSLKVIQMHNTGSHEPLAIYVVLIHVTQDYQNSYYFSKKNMIFLKYIVHSILLDTVNC